MKKLSIEEKARRYDEAIERAKEFKEHLLEINEKDYADEMDYVFPELAESDDERIRKALIDYFRWNPNSQLLNEFTNREVFAWLEKQEPADKVEPKFRNGQWVVWQDKCYKVNDNGCGYELVDQDGLSTSLEYGTVDENAHLWNVTSDAKPGDVIYLPNGNNEYYFFIFKGIENAAVMSFAHFYQYNDGTSEVEGTIDKLSSVNDVFRPATKEQRDLLFQEMKEAGYEWDADKRELKKIGKNLDWSEEDEDRVNRLIAYFEDKESFTAEDDIVYANWLKSLRPQNKWKPSDAQMASITCAVRKMKESACYDSELVSLLNDLKNLK